MKERIIAKISEKLEFEYLEVIDNSRLHKSHVKKMIGPKELNRSKGTHFKIIISSTYLNSLSSIEAHRCLNSILKEELRSGVHALEIFIARNPESRS